MSPKEGEVACTTAMGLIEYNIVSNNELYMEDVLSTLRSSMDAQRFLGLDWTL